MKHSNRRLLFNVESYLCSGSQFNTFHDPVALSLKQQQAPVITMQLISQLQSAVTSLSTATAVTLPNSNAGYALTALQVPSRQNSQIAILLITDSVPYRIPTSGFVVNGCGGRQISSPRFLERKRCNSISQWNNRHLAKLSATLDYSLALLAALFECIQGRQLDWNITQNEFEGHRNPREKRKRMLNCSYATRAFP
jgi:hypothetical protein